MKQCNHCGASLDDDALFCTSCGTKVENGRHCIHCGASIDSDSLFCSSCGGRQEDRIQQILPDSEDSTETFTHSNDAGKVGTENPTKNWYYISGSVLGVLIFIGGLFFLLNSNSATGTFADMPIEKVFPKVLKVVEVNVENANLRTGPGTDSPIAIDPMNAQDGVKYVASQGIRFAVMEDVDEWYKLAAKDKNGAQTYIKKTLCRDLVTGIIPEDNIHTDWFNQNFECGGGVSVVRQPKGNRLVISYTHIECDADELLLGVYQDGVYLFYYSLPVTSLSFDENKKGVTIEKSSGESIFYEGSYGKDMARKVHFDWGEYEDVDWAKVPEEKLAEIFNLVISEGYRNVKVLTARDIEEAKNQKPDEETGLSGFSYIVDDEYDSDVERTVYNLAVKTVSGEKISTGTTDYAVELTIIAQGDYDSDGEKEAIVYEWGGGNSAQPPYLVYYDKDTEVFKKAEGFKDVYDNANISIEEWKGKTSIVSTVGLRKDRYVFENKRLLLAERIMPDVGRRIVTISLKQLFGENGSDLDKSINLDIDGDGETEHLTFHHDDSHALDWGKRMSLEKIVESDWTIPMSDDERLNVTGYSFTFLSSNNRGVPDILCDEAWIYRWDGNRYVLKE